MQQGVDSELALKPFMPAAIQVLECSFLSGIKYVKTLESYVLLLRTSNTEFVE
jgi:hypothetical protein